MSEHPPSNPSGPEAQQGSAAEVEQSSGAEAEAEQASEAEQSSGAETEAEQAGATAPVQGGRYAQIVHLSTGGLGIEIRGPRNTSAQSLALINAVQDLNRRLQLLHQRNVIAHEDLLDYFRQIVGPAQLGLIQGELAPAARDIAEIESHLVVRYAPEVVGRYLYRLGAPALALGLLLFLIGLGIHQKWVAVPWSATTSVVLECFCYALAASLGGMWTAHAARQKFSLSLRELVTPSRDPVPPLLRCLKVFGLTTPLFFLSFLGAMGVEIGQFETSNVGASGTVAVTFGFVCGFGEDLLLGRVTPIVRTVLDPGARGT
tara:strand:- start:332 stop:1282 length:951 start_codon:yes stop_codon:yes gene_type:complete